MKVAGYIKGRAYVLVSGERVWADVAARQGMQITGGQRMYKVFVLSTVQGYAHAEVRRNGEFLTSARGATTAQALRTVKRNVRIARHAGEFEDSIPTTDDIEDDHWCRNCGTERLCIA